MQVRSITSQAGNRDWLAVATNSRVESLLRDDGLFGLAFTPPNTGSVPECRITNGGFKSLDFQYRNPPSSNQCFGPVEHVYFNKVESATTETILPDEDPIYSGDVNCTYFEAPFNLNKDGNGGFDYWGTDKGLFVKTYSGCGLSSLKKIQGINVKVNDLEELNFFRDFFNDKSMLVAADDGLYYGGGGSLVPEGTSELDRIGFIKLHNFNTGVNSIAVELHGFEVTEPGEYTLEVEDASGCKASTLYMVVPYCTSPVPPNAFSPNGDGINDLWTVGGLEDETNVKIHVYNRFGVSVFDGSAKQPSWNGRLKGTNVPEGTYYYVVIKRSAKPMTGSLVLIR